MAEPMGPAKATVNTSQRMPSSLRHRPRGTVPVPRTEESTGSVGSVRLAPRTCLGITMVSNTPQFSSSSLPASNPGPRARPTALPDQLHDATIDLQSVPCAHPCAQSLGRGHCNLAPSPRDARGSAQSDSITPVHLLPGHTFLLVHFSTSIC